MRHWRSVVVILCAFAALGPLSFANAADPAQIEGEYQCDDCHGFLTIKRLGTAEFQVWFGVGGGSCGGETPIVRKAKYTGGGVLKLPYRVGQKQCAAQIEFTDAGAFITDSCFTAQDEASSTCATLGSYTRMKK